MSKAGWVGVALGGLVLVGCTESVWPDPIEDPAPQGCVSLEVTSFDFVVNDSAGADDVTGATLAIRNPCDGDVEGLTARLVDPDGAFAWDGLATSTLAPGDELEGSVSLTARDIGSYAAELRLTHADAPDEPVVIDLQAVVNAPALDARPAEVSFPTTPVGCSSVESVVLENHTEVDATVASLQFTGAGSFSATPQTELPVVLAPGGSLSIELTASPLDRDTGALIAKNTDGNEIARVPLTARGAIGSWSEDDVTVYDPEAPMDLLLTFARSSCNNDRIAELTEGLDDLPAAFRDRGYDLHMAAAVADDGCILGDTLAIDETFDAAATRQALDQMIDIDFEHSLYGANTERGFTLALNALGETGHRACNSGFLREDSFLQIVHVSNDVEQSTYSPSAYVTNLHHYRPEGQVVVHAITGPVPFGCDNSGPGTGYDVAVTKTGGAFISTCDKIEDQMATLYGRVLNQRGPTPGTLPLTKDPVERTIQVTVDETPVHSDAWTWEPQRRRIVVDVLPPAGSVLSARYVPQPVCD